MVLHNLMCKDCLKCPRNWGCSRCTTCHRAHRTKVAALNRRKKKEQMLLHNSKLAKKGKQICSMCFKEKKLCEFDTSMPNNCGKRNAICDMCLTRVYSNPVRAASNNLLGYAFWRKRAYSCNSTARNRLSRARRRTVTLSGLPYVCKPQDLSSMYAAQDGKCAYCKIELNTHNLTVDHVVPLSKLGAHALANLTLACTDCNHLKYDKSAEEFADFIQEYAARFSNRTSG